MSKRRNTELAIRRRENQELALIGNRRCGSCFDVLDLSSFYKSKTANSYSSCCIKCVRKAVKDETANATRMERPDLEGNKTCTMCHESKDVSFFTWNAKKKRLLAECTPCSRKRNLKWIDDNRVRINEQVLARRNRDIEKYRKQATERYAKDPEKIKKPHRKWNKANSRKILDRMAERKKEDPIFKMSHNIRTLIYIKIKRGGYTKKSKVTEILGCCSEDLFAWIEAHKRVGPSEEAHLDHVLPAALSSTEEELLALNHYSNFQMISKEQNIDKGNRWVYRQDLDRVVNNHPKPDLITNIIQRSNIEIKEYGAAS